MARRSVWVGNSRWPGLATRCLLCTWYVRSLNRVGIGSRRTLTEDRQLISSASFRVPPSQEYTTAAICLHQRGPRTLFSGGIDDEKVFPTAILRESGDSLHSEYRACPRRCATYRPARIPSPKATTPSGRPPRRGSCFVPLRRLLRPVGSADRRNAWLWFFLGLFFNVVTLLVLLYKNSRERRSLG